MTSNERQDLLDRIATLEEEVFNRSLAVRNYDELAFKIYCRYSLPRSPAMLLRHMILKSYLTQEHAFEILEANGAYKKQKDNDPRFVLRMQIHFIRRVIKLDKVSIVNLRDVGYCIMSKDIARLKTLLEVTT